MLSWVKDLIKCDTVAKPTYLEPASWAFECKVLIDFVMSLLIVSYVNTGCVFLCVGIAIKNNLFVCCCLTFLSLFLLVHLVALVHFWRRSLPIHRFVRPSIFPSACLPACQFQLASGEVSLTILTSTIVGEYRRVFYKYPGPTNEQCHIQNV